MKKFTGQSNLEMKRLAAGLVKKRKSKRLTLRALAKETGISAAQLFRIEQGGVTPRLDTFLNLCNWLAKT